MKISFTKTFSRKLYAQAAYIAKDKPIAARNFQRDLILELESIGSNPFKFRQSIFSSDPNVRDYVFKGYTITYRVKEKAEEIVVFGLIKNQKK